MTAPAWLPIAQRFLGVREIPGPKHSSVISGWLAKLRGAWWSDDETPWCGTFVAAVLQEAGHELPKHWYRAKAWAEWGSKLSAPELGCVVVFDREGGGHVGFVVGRGPGAQLAVLGGNQGNEVNVRMFPRDRVISYRWPLAAPVQMASLPPYVAPKTTGEA